MKYRKRETGGETIDEKIGAQPAEETRIEGVVPFVHTGHASRDYTCVCVCVQKWP